MRALPCLPVPADKEQQLAMRSTVRRPAPRVWRIPPFGPRLYAHTLTFKKVEVPFYFEYAFVACGCPASLTAISSRILPTKATMKFLALFTCTTGLVLALALRYSYNQISFKRKYKLPPRVPGIPFFGNTFQIPRYNAGAWAKGLAAKYGEM